MSQRQNRMRRQYRPALCCWLTLPMICAKFCVVPPEYFQEHRVTNATRHVILEVEENGISTQSCCVQTEADIQFSSNQKTPASISCTDNAVTPNNYTGNDFQMTLSNLKLPNDTSTKIFVIRNAKDTRIKAENILIYGKFVTIKCGPSEDIKTWCLSPNNMTTGTTTDVAQSTVGTDMTTGSKTDVTDQPLSSFWQENQEYIIYASLATVILVLLIIVGCLCSKISRLKKQFTTKQSEETEGDLTHTGQYKQRNNTRKSYLLSWHPKFLTEKQVSGDSKNNADSDVPCRDKKIKRRKSYLMSWTPKSLRKDNDEPNGSHTAGLQSVDVCTNTNNEHVGSANSNQNIQMTTIGTNASRSQNRYIDMGKM